MGRRLIWLLLWLCLALPAGAGTVEGTVVVRPGQLKKPHGDKQRPGGPPPGAQPYLQRDRSASARTNEAVNTVVYLKGAKPSKAAPGTRASISQRDRTFIPFVTAVQAGTTVEFPNQDIIYHSVYSNSEPREFHLPEYPQGESRQVTFEKPGHVELFCAIHSHMNAHLLVLDTSHFTRPDTEGRFRLENIPPGTYVVKAWHPLLGERSQTVTVGKGTTTVELLLE